MKNKKTEKPKKSRLSAQVERALIRAGNRAREIARMYGTPVYYLRNGKIVAEKP